MWFRYDDLLEIHVFVYTKRDNSSPTQSFSRECFKHEAVNIILFHWNIISFSFFEILFSVNIILLFGNIVHVHFSGTNKWTTIRLGNEQIAYINPSPFMCNMHAKQKYRILSQYILHTIGHHRWVVSRFNLNWTSLMYCNPIQSSFDTTVVF
jgi:hypothetical protein